MSIGQLIPSLPSKEELATARSEALEMVRIQGERITPSYSLPNFDVTFDAYKFESLHKRIMDAATKWAKSDVYYYGIDKKTEAATYLIALTLIMAGCLPEKEINSIYDEYQAMLFGKGKKNIVVREG